MQILEEDKGNVNIILLAQSFSLIYDNSENVSNKFNEIDQSFLDREFRSNYNFLKRNIDSKTSFSRKVGVVLPLSGENMEMTNAFLKGLLQANLNSQSKDKIQFIIINNFEDPILTVEAFKDLVERHNVLSLIHI